LLPGYKLILLGDSYIVKSPLRSNWNNAWLLKKEDAEKMESDIQQIILLAYPHYNLDVLAHQKRGFKSTNATRLNEVAQSVR
jgi:hypothetical protein